MSPLAPSKSRFGLPVFIAILAIAVLSIAYAVLHNGPWIVPVAAKQLKNPLKPSEAELAVARSIYLDKCSDCHGEAGRGDGPQAKMYDTKPSDLTATLKLGKITDGELFYKITHGHKPMPAFKKRLTETQRWQLVLLIRDISHSSSPPPPSAAN